jgi:hypothetical protein
MTQMYVKHPDYMGNNLALHVGSGQRTIFDNDILEGPKWAKFVGMGFLRQCTPEEVANVLKGRAGRAATKKAAAPATKAPTSRDAMLLAMDADDLYKVAQEIDLPGRTKVKGNKDALVSAILQHEEALIAREAAKVEEDAAAALAAQEEAEAEAKAKAEADAAEAEAEAAAAADEGTPTTSPDTPS